MLALLGINVLTLACKRGDERVSGKRKLTAFIEVVELGFWDFTGDWLLSSVKSLNLGIIANEQNPYFGKLRGED